MEQSLSLFQKRDDLDELEGFQQQELAKVKHMVRTKAKPLTLTHRRHVKHGLVRRVLPVRSHVCLKLLTVYLGYKTRMNQKLSASPLEVVLLRHGVCPFSY